MAVSVPDLPILVINTDTAILDEPKVDAHLGVIDTGDNSFGDAFSGYDGFIGIELRGSSSQLYPKKAYSIETRDANGEDLDVSLLGLPAESDWVLYAPFSDKTLIRNAFVYDMARDMGHYASRHRFVELYLNDSYEGVYVLFEKIKRGKNRVAIDKVNDEGEGGYLLELESTYHYEHSAYFVSKYEADKAFFFKYPKPDKLSETQKNHMQTYLDGFEAALYGDDFKNPEKGYAPFIDQASFIDYILISEVFKNRDFFRRSAFLYKDKEGILHLGPVWDFNISLGNDESAIGSEEGFLLRERGFWGGRLLEDAAFKEAFITRYQDLRQTLWRDAIILERLTEMARQLGDAKLRNFERWQILGHYVYPNSFVGETYEEELDYLLMWLLVRLEWVDEHIDEL